jgi:20S proteasome subunit beta 1
MNQIFPNPVKSSQEEESTGTTIMAIKYDKGVLIAADSRATSGSYVAHRCTDKLEYIHDRIYCNNKVFKMGINKLDF